MKEIWLFEAIEALEIVAATRAPKGLGGLLKEKCVLKVP